MSKHPKNPAPATKPATHPWVIDGIDYGPAIAAVGELAAWAFELAARDVVDWPEGRRRVRNARRFVLARLRGKHLSSAPFEDVLFTAGLLARIFEAEIGLGMTDVVEILDNLGLPTEMVPLQPRVQGSAHHVVLPAVVPRVPEHVDVLASSTEARIAELFAAVDIDMDDDEQEAPCEECGQSPRFRNAA